MRSVEDFWTGTQLRAARTLLDWTQRDLAYAADTPAKAPGWIENGNPRGELYFGNIIDALEAAGIVLIGQDDPDLGKVTAVALIERPQRKRPQLTLVVDNT